MDNIAKNNIQDKGAVSQTLFDTRAMHGDKPPAIDRKGVSDEWLKIWSLVWRNLTPLQKGALVKVVQEAES